SVWIELAAESESNGDLAAAERHLVRATEVDATFEPRWALANFYFRRDRTEEFWKWMRLAAERSYGDRAGLFQLAWRSGADGGEIQRRLVDGLGEVLGRYVEWLGKQRKWEAAGAASLALVNAGQKADSAAALEVCHQLLDQGETGQALAVWNALAGAGWVRGSALPGDGVLTNPRFEWEPTGKGFDWRLPWRPGLAHRWRAGELTIVMDGKQEERTDLLEQVVAVRGGRPYELRYRYRSDGLVKNAGVRWRMRATGAEVAGDPVIPGELAEGRLRFTAPAGRDQVRLVLTYERLPGTVRPEATIIIEGTMELFAVR
ncbi:MAG: hypothetical protein HY820_03585, partial [Acidobacteria bacterium]|nr:hypothetical protein [Acidobacteriota bacterium]